ncbi:MAG: type II CRISPR RNA-guided endonuclease Cas9 [Sulfurospirillum sp.]|nr:MAG: type II CRISPR RNA-guided endonuclease Cas9 [Sulfurospirillum sp.]
MESKKILSLDLGITSLGYAVLEEIEQNSYKCLDNSVIMRDSPYDNSGDSKQSLRSKQASLRKLISKRKRRIKNLAKLFEKYKLFSYKDAIKLQKENKYKNKWILRAVDALQRELSIEEIFSIMAHMAKHRGYKSISLEDLLYELKIELGLIDSHKENNINDDEKRKVYAALNQLEQLKVLYPSETISQTIHRAVKDGKLRSYRNHGDYEKMIRREDIEDEIETIINKQYRLGAIKLNGDEIVEFIEELKEIITDQIMPQNDMNLVGRCTFFKDEYAAPKFSFLYDLYRLYKTLADLRIRNYEITDKDRYKIVETIFEKLKNGKNVKDITYKEVRKILSLSEDQKIYDRDDTYIVNKKREQRRLVKFFFISEVSKYPNIIKSIILNSNSIEIFAKIAEIIREHKTPKPAIKEIKTLLTDEGISIEDSEILSLVETKKSGTLSISHKFIIDALPLFKDGKNEKEIQEILGVTTTEDYSTFPKSLKYLHLGRGNLFENGNFGKAPINNHAVKSLASWSLKRVAELSWRYGPFDEIVIESARDILPEKKRKEIERGMHAKEKEIDKIIKEYKNEFPTIDRKMARKLNLLKSQKFLDIYTGRTINISDLFNGNADIEHIVPRSLGGLSTEYNLVISYKDSNMKKGNRLPMDWLGEDIDYINRVEMLRSEYLINTRKYKNLLAKNLDEVIVEVKDSKSMRATSYIEALVSEVLKMFYPFLNPVHRKYGNAVRNIPGRTTSKARNLLGIKSKSRDTNFHHSEDAMILAAISRGWQNRLHRLLRENYGKSEDELKKIWQNHTPHIEGMAIDEYIKEAFERFMSRGEDSLWYQDMFGGIRSISYWVNKKPILASSHKDTIYSPKHKVPTLRKDINNEFSNLDIIKDRHSINRDKFMKKYEEKIRSKLWYNHIVNYNDPVMRAIDKKANDIASIFDDPYYLNSKKDKEIDEKFKEKLSETINSPIMVDGKRVRSVRFVYSKLNAIKITRGVVESDKNMMGIYVEKGNKKLQLHRIDVNNFHNFKEKKDGMMIYLNDMVIFFNKKGIIHYGALRSYVDSIKKVALFNPRYPSSPKLQPKQFSTGTQIKQVGIGSTTGLIKIVLDLSGTIKSYEKFGTIPKESEDKFLKESGYGILEDD